MPLLFQDNAQVIGCFEGQVILRSKHAPLHLKRLAEKTLACSDTAGKIAAEAGVKKLVLTHFRHMTPQLLAAVGEDVRRDYGGPVHLANDLDEFEV